MSRPAPLTDPLGGVEGLKEPQRLSRQLATLLAAEIVSGRIAVGNTFPSADEIVARFGVSRTVVREALHSLAMLRLVRVQHGKRAEVQPPEEWDILSSVVQEALRREGKVRPLLRDLYEFRLLIEPQAAAWMADHGNESDLATLGELAARMERLARSDVAMSEVLETDRNFHNLVAHASSNRVVAAVSRDIKEIVETLWAFSTLEPDELKQVAAHHRAIADAIQRRDSAAAADAMREHLAWAAQADLDEARGVSGAKTGADTTVH